MKVCTHCQHPFQITEKDQAFYKRMEVPEPTLCPLCRIQRRLSYRNERFLYHRKCELTGKSIISSFSTDKPFPVYDNDAWWSDDWDPLDYGQDFDFNRPFFEQFFELRDKVPRQAMQQQKPMINSDYCNCASRNKNCYLLFSTNYCEDSYYGSWVNYAKNCVDNLYIKNCELCYDCVGCQDCYNVRYSRDSTNCKNSFFLRNCKGCTDCFGCSNLINKQYYIFNKPHTKEEYEAFLEEVNTGNHVTIEKIKEKLEGVLNDLVVREYIGVNNQNVLGDYINQCKNCYHCFEVDASEDLSYCHCINNSKDCMDYSYWGQESELVYETQASGYNLFNIRFCNLCWDNCSNLTYCDQIFSSKNCFGSVGLKKKQYCILNKQYSKQEYEELIPKIIKHMKKTGEWGEFFPTSQSIYAYNETLAYEQLPLTKEEVLKRGWPWKDEEEGSKNYKGPAYEIPDDIKNVSDEITKQILISEKSGKPYKIIPQELKFYKENNIPIPRLTPDERHWERLKKRNPRALFDRQCENCQKEIQTTYAPDRPEKVFCEECYLKEVY